MKVLITGSRRWDRPDVIEACLDIIATEAAGEGVERMTVVHGCAPGADTAADLWARRDGHPLAVTIDRHPAKWATEGRVAGLNRNRRMVATRPDVVLAFVRDRSRGTEHCIRIAEDHHIPVQRIDYADIGGRDAGQG